MSPTVDSGSPGALTGARYRASLNDGRQVWMSGQRVSVTEHPAFAGMLGELCRLLDLQHVDEFRDRLTFAGDDGVRISRSYQLPRGSNDLHAKRVASEVWADESWGLLPSSPDYLANIMVGLYDCRSELAVLDSVRGQNAERYFHHVAANGLIVAHPLPDPHAQRAELYPGVAPSPTAGLEVVEERADGIVVKGVKTMAPLAPFAHEVFVTYTSTLAPADPRSVQWFAIPMNTPGVKLLCGEPRSPYASGHTFARRYAEPDTTVFFDNVLVPWDRVFLLGDFDASNALQRRLHAWSLFSSNIRLHNRLWTLVGVTTMMAEATGTDAYRNVRDKLGECILYPEVFLAAVTGTELDAALTPGGLFAPSAGLAVSAAAEFYLDRILQLVKDVGGAGMLMQPSEADLANPELQPLINEYLATDMLPADEKARLFRLAWDLVGDGNGARNDLFERFQRGDHMWLANELYRTYDRSNVVARIQREIDKPLPQGETPPAWKH